jgi:outer membrane protein TolC
LRRVLNVAERNWTRPIVPMDAPIFKEESLDLRALVIKGQSRRPEVLRAKLGVDRAAFEKRVANNNRLPRLDVGVGYGVAGGDETFGRSLSRLSELNDRYWTAFVSLSWAPLGLETGAEQDRAKVEAERARVEKRQLLEDIRLQVREAVRAVRTAARQVRAAARSRALAEQSLEVEERKFLNGMSSNFVMAQRQEELAQARLAELNAVVEHSKARVNLDYATGVLLERHHVELALRTAR